MTGNYNNNNNNNNVLNQLIMLIGALSQVCFHGFFCSRIQEKLLFQRLMECHSLPKERIDRPITLSERYMFEITSNKTRLDTDEFETRNAHPTKVSGARDVCHPKCSRYFGAER